MSDSLLPSLLSGFNDDLLNKLAIGRKTAEHPVLRGDASEDSWLAMLNTYLPKRYSASKGFVVDSLGNKSNQIDLIIFDRQYSPFIFKMDSIEYVPAESVYAVFEVKQTLNRDHIIYAQRQIKSVRDLKRTSLPIPSMDGKSSVKEPAYIHGGLLCFDSGWNPPFGKPFESAVSEGPKESLVNLTCVASLGMYEVDENNQILKMSNQATTYFFLRLIAILQEKGTVPMMDVMAYASWLETTEKT